MNDYSSGGNETFYKPWPPVTTTNDDEEIIYDEESNEIEKPIDYSMYIYILLGGAFILFLIWFKKKI